MRISHQRDLPGTQDGALIAQGPAQAAKNWGMDGGPGAFTEEGVRA